MLEVRGERRREELREIPLFREGARNPLNLFYMNSRYEKKQNIFFSEVLPLRFGTGVFWSQLLG